MASSGSNSMRGIREPQYRKGCRVGKAAERAVIRVNRKAILAEKHEKLSTTNITGKSTMSSREKEANSQRGSILKNLEGGTPR